MDEGQEEATFVAEEVTQLVMDVIEPLLAGSNYQHNRINQWSSAVVEQSLNSLTKLGKPFKYIVNCVIMQKTGAGFHQASSCYWDNATDGSCTVRWENKTMYCIVSVFALAT
ncbi:dynein light chain Tctex-type 1-like [Sycon ciliatum]|uniref:dynein light chain Tctex-type 1-like n=1 Tax=Sycon ciliatum TaxID=27933 RepID=UPI0020AB5710|eukprot:scpid86630/ scgid35578/ Dynein light chain Tctex-type 1; Activator of G-protein signaling 2; T-complex testis-specific protein 1 homolog